MIIPGLSFHIPTKNNGIVAVNNFHRSNELIDGDDVIYIDELNKSDYLFQTAILYIIRKIKRSNKTETDKLYSLINEIELLMRQIYLSELRKLDIIIEGEDTNDISDDLILSRSYRLSSICLEERIFEYDE